LFRTSRLIPAAAIVVLAAFAILAWVFISQGTSGQMAEIGGPFTLQNGDGQTVTDRDLRGHYLLIYFGYTSCPDVCPTTLTQIANALDALGAKGRDVQPVFITVDPARDTPKVVHDYATAFSPRILGLTGTSGQIAKVAREYKVYYVAHTPADGKDYSVDHSSVVYLMGPDGRFIAPLRTDSAPDLAADIARHLAAG
jgi:protein SCO1/2